MIIASVWLHMDIHAKIGGFTWLAIGLVVLLAFRLRGLSLPEVDKAHAATPTAAGHPADTAGGGRGYDRISGPVLPARTR